MNRQNSFNGLQLEDNLLFNDEVDSVATVQLHIFVDDGQFDLLPKTEAVEFQFVTQTSLISRF